MIEGENLNVTVGSIPLNEEEKEPVKANILKLLKNKYGFEEEDSSVLNLKLYRVVKLVHVVLMNP